MFDYPFRVTLSLGRELTFIEESRLETALHNLIAGAIACQEKAGAGEFADIELSDVDVTRADI